MKVYIDLTLLPGDDIGIYFLWQKLYQQVHLAFAEQNNAKGTQPVAVAFPNYRPRQLGNKLRLLAMERSDLEALKLSQWLSRLTDYIHQSSIRDVPDNVTGYVSYSRLRSETSGHRLAARYARRHNVTLEEAKKRYQGFRPEYLEAPFIQMQSLSGDNAFRLFIGQTLRDKPNEEHKPVNFGSYGLSGKSALPCF